MEHQSVIPKRKLDHILICLNHDVEFTQKTAGFEKYEFVHQALPEIDKDEIDISMNLFGKMLKAPIIIEAMTGGTEVGGQINETLARAAQHLQIGMMVGSQRVAFEHTHLSDTFQVRHKAPDILLIANLGAVQLNNGFSVETYCEAVSMINADALALHLNPLQEAIQAEGNTNFRGLIKKIEMLRGKLPVPLIVKEVGCGISKEVAAKLKEVGVDCIDVGGAGGTSWARIEAIRATTALQKHLGESFSEWGIPTAESIVLAKHGAPDLPIIASGGIRSGLDVAKAIALGAEAVGLALPLLKPSMVSTQEVVDTLEHHIEVLKTAMFCVGAANLESLRQTIHLNGKRFLHIGMDESS